MLGTDRLLHIIRAPSGDHRVVLLVDDGEAYVMVRRNGRVSEGKSAELNTEKLVLSYEGERNAGRRAVDFLREKHVMIEVTPWKVVSQGL